MRDFLGKNYTTITRIALLTGIFLLLYISVKYLLPVFSPFITAFVLALICEPSIVFLEKRFKIPRKAASIISLIIVIAILGTLLSFCTIRLYDELSILQNKTSIYIKGILGQLSAFLNDIPAYLNNLPFRTSDIPLNINLGSFTPQLEKLVNSVVSHLIDMITSIPSILIFVLVTLLSTFFMSSERHKIRQVILNQLPGTWAKNITGIKSDAFSSIIGYGKVLLVLMGLTFLEVIIGLVIMNHDYPLLMGLLVGLSSAVPIFGTSIVMIPWILTNFLLGDISTGLGLIIIFLLGVLMRFIIREYITETHIKLHPLATLISMYVGLQIFGVLGVVIGPLAVIILKNLYTTGILRPWAVKQE